VRDRFLAQRRVSQSIEIDVYIREVARTEEFAARSKS